MSDFTVPMLEGQTLTSDHAITADVCVVGTGPGGAVTAATLAKRGLRVVVLEEGGYFTSSRLRMREDEAFPYLYQDGGQRTTKDLAIAIYQGRAVGGGTMVNWTTCFRTPDDVLEHWRTKHAVESLSSTELASHFDVVEKRLGVNKVHPDAMNRNNRVLYDGARALNYDVDTVKRNVVGCAQTGYCGHGCPINAKQSTFVTYLPDAMDAGATVISRCRVDRVVAENGRAHHVEARFLDASGRTPTGATLRVTAARIVVSGGAINTPALLLRSGLPDPHERVGVRTFLHPVVMGASIYDELVEPYYGAPQSAACHHFAHRGDEVGFFIEAAPGHPGLAGSAFPGIGESARLLMKKLPFAAAHVAITIDGFHDDVQGGRVSVDGAGHPVLDYPIAERQWRAFREAHRAMARINMEMGAVRYLTAHDPPVFIKKSSEIDVVIDRLPYAPNKVFLGSAHQMGGAGVSDDKTKGVVRSSDLQHHHVDGLHIIDGSVFPTSLGVNPQETIFGIASLVSSRIAAQSP